MVVFRAVTESEILNQALYVLSTTLEREFDEMSNSLLHRTTSIRGRYKAEAVFDERRSTAGREQERQKDMSGKSGTIKPVRPCTGLIVRFANSKTCF